jgi:hypothetical protein
MAITPITHSVRLTHSGGGSSVSGTVSDTADGEINQQLDVPVSGSGGTDMEVDIDFVKTKLKAFFALSTQALTIETNANDATGGNTIALVANVPYWYSVAAGHVNPFIEHVTRMFLTNGSASAAAEVKIRVLYDASV